MIGSRCRLATLAAMLFFSPAQEGTAQFPVPRLFVVWGMATSVVPGPGNTLSITGEGWATHLGRYTVSATQTLIPGAPPTFVGDVVFTAANGDELYAMVSGVVTEPPPNPGGEGSYQITGGTGRFEGATGRGAFITHGGRTLYIGIIRLTPGHRWRHHP